MDPNLINRQRNQEKNKEKRDEKNEENEENNKEKKDEENDEKKSGGIHLGDKPKKENKKKEKMSNYVILISNYNKLIINISINLAIYFNVIVLY